MAGAAVVRTDYLLKLSTAAEAYNQSRSSEGSSRALNMAELRVLETAVRMLSDRVQQAYSTPDHDVFSDAELHGLVGICQQV